MKIFITGGAGFIGCNLADYHLKRGDRVIIFDNLSRKGTEMNLAWLRERHGDLLTFVRGDIRDFEALRAAIPPDAARVYHMAGQVAVTTSVANPREDFECNALGTFNVLEAVRAVAPQAILFYASTNKVYGGMEEIAIVEEATRYRYRDFPLGIPESQPLDFHSPYGCCYSEDTDILTRAGWKKFYELTPEDEVLTYNLERRIAQYQKPTSYFAYPYKGKMYVQTNRRLRTCVTPNHKMLVAWDCDHNGLKNPRLLEAQSIEGKPMSYLLAADVEEEDNAPTMFVLPEVKPDKRYGHYFPARPIPMEDWLRFLGWYISEGHCREDQRTGNCTVTLTTYYRVDEALAVMRAIGLSPVVNKHHVTATSRQLYEYVKSLGKSRDRYIPADIKKLNRGHLLILLKSLLDGDGNQQNKNSWRYTTVSRQLADDIQEIALKCGMASSVTRDKWGFYRVYISTTRTARCNLGKNRSTWVDYEGQVYCVEVPNSIVMVRQNGHAYFSGNSKGAGDQYVRDYARIYGMRTVVFRQSCLAADQPVLTPFGLKPIAALQPGDIVHNGEGWTRVRHVEQTGVKPVRRLATMGGLQVTLTADHLVFRPHGLFSCRNLAYGDFLAVLPEARYAPVWEAVPDQVLTPEVYLAAVQERTNDQRCLNEARRIAARLLPLQGDRLLAIAEVVGWLFGDGHLGIHKRQTRESPSYTVQYFGSESELSELSRWLYWLGLPTGSVIRWDATSRLPSGHLIEGRACRIQQQSIPIFTLFEMLGVPVGDKVRVDYGLPDWIARGHRLVKRAFLRGFLGAELTRVNANSSLAPSFAQSKDVSHLESGRRWIEQLRALLAEFGIQTSCFEAEPVEYKRGTTVQITVRLLGGNELWPKLAAIGYAFSKERSERLNGLLRWQWTHTTTDWFEQAYKLYRADGMLFWDGMMRAEELDEQPVYDLEVEADNHLFVAGGVQVSNCIFGTRQFGVEDQGWVAHFCIAARLGRPIIIYGDGKQVRDVLWIDDLIAAYEAAAAHIDVAAGQIYNIGGGPENTMSIWAEFGPLLETLAGHPIPVSYAGWRPGDQLVYISDIRKAERELGWRPLVSVDAGIRRLWRWVDSNPGLF